MALLLSQSSKALPESASHRGSQPVIETHRASEPPGRVAGEEWGTVATNQFIPALKGIQIQIILIVEKLLPGCCPHPEGGQDP